MEDSANGKFCSKCHKEVFDLTNCSTEEVHALQAKHGSICGSVRMAHAAVGARSLSAAACEKLGRTTGKPMPMPTSSNKSGANHGTTETPRVMGKVGPSAENTATENPDAIPTDQEIPKPPMLIGVVCPQPKINKNGEPKGPVIDG